MSADQFHRVMMASMFLNLFLVVFLFLLEPIVGVLWLLLSLLLLVLQKRKHPTLFQEEKDRFLAPFYRMKKKIWSIPEDPDQRKIDFVCEYELVLKRSNGDRHYRIYKENFLVGRGSRCDARLDGDKAIGREHCRILFRKYSQEYYIEDLRSRSGTYLGTKRLDPFTQEKLLPNTELTLGNSRLQFKKR